MGPASLFRRPDDRFTSAAAIGAASSCRRARSVGCFRASCRPNPPPGPRVLVARRYDLGRDGLGSSGFRGPVAARSLDDRRFGVDLARGRRRSRLLPRRAWRNRPELLLPPHATPAPTPRRAGAHLAGPARARRPPAALLNERGRRRSCPAAPAISARRRVRLRGLRAERVIQWRAGCVDRIARRLGPLEPRELARGPGPLLDLGWRSIVDRWSFIFELGPFGWPQTLHRWASSIWRPTPWPINREPYKLLPRGTPRQPSTRHLHQPHRPPPG